jgi:hypothetical protein
MGYNLDGSLRQDQCAALTESGFRNRPSIPDKVPWHRVSAA